MTGVNKLDNVDIKLRTEKSDDGRAVDNRLVTRLKMAEECDSKDNQRGRDEGGRDEESSIDISTSISKKDKNLNDKENSEKNTLSNKKKYRTQGEVGSENMKNFLCKKGFRYMSLEKRKAAASKGGKAGHRTTVFTKCVNCELRFTCHRAFEEANIMHEKGEIYLADKRTDVNIEKYTEFPVEKSRCVIEMEGRHMQRHQLLRKLSAFTGSNPDHMLERMYVVFNKIEEIADQSPSYTKYQNMFYMLMSLFKMKYPEVKSGTRINIATGNTIGLAGQNPTIDVKSMMQELRDDSAIDVDGKFVSNKEDAQGQKHDDDNQRGGVP